MNNRCAIKEGSKVIKGYAKSAKKWYHSIMVLWPYYVITSESVIWGIFFDEISVSLDRCITGLWHPINRNYVFNRDWVNN